ncbi:MAG: Uma2 family endonuclease, partial [Symploca sp. SIO1B1]|nr:Uma2 family endonuclease [Symploca sp. SIO1B1]
KLNGGQYQEQSLNQENAIAWLADLEIGLGIWEGVFEGVPGSWLRWCDRAGNWLLTDTEQVQTQLLQAAQNLLATGMDIEQVVQLLGLSEGQVKALQLSD